MSLRSCVTYRLSDLTPTATAPPSSAVALGAGSRVPTHHRTHLLLLLLLAYASTMGFLLYGALMDP
ncbi:hypothetical protein ABZP36_017481 [Zizania latifolia]